MLVRPGGPLAAEVNDWRRFLASADDASTVDHLRRHGRTGRPLGDGLFVHRLERLLGRDLEPGRPDRPKKERK